MNKLMVTVDCIEPPNGRFPIWSNLYIQYGLWAFPSENWNDATSAVLAMWMDNFTKLLQNANVAVELSFMDGDYRIEVQLKEGFQAQFSFFSGESCERVISQVDIQHFARQLLSASSKIAFVDSKQVLYPVKNELIDSSNHLRQALKYTE